jgi:D-alanyl-D-alanine carboxypeptidase (penicillin-binding protein 5/6)
MHKKISQSFKQLTSIGALILSLILPTAYSLAAPVDSTESTAETQAAFPDSYYDPIQSNETPNWPQGPQIEAEAAIIMEAGSGAILYEKNIDKELYPASITKIMTALVALEHGSLNDIVTFSENAVNNLEEGSSHIGMRAGEKLTLKQCLYGIMLESANEVSNAVAEHIAGSVEEFAKMMNEKAAALGCQHTHFTNPHGLQDESHYTSAYDMALILNAALKNPTFVEIAGTSSYTLPITNIVAEERHLNNHLKMLLSNTDYFYNGCMGGKTGFTSTSLNTLVTFSKKGNMELISVVLKVNGAGKIYNETASLLNYAYDNFKAVLPGDKMYNYISGSSDFGLNSLMMQTTTSEDYKKSSSYYYVIPKDIKENELEHTITMGTPDSSSDLIISYMYQGRFLGTHHLYDAKDNILSYPPQEILPKEVTHSPSELESSSFTSTAQTADEVKEEPGNVTFWGISHKLKSLLTEFKEHPFLLAIPVIMVIIFIFIIYLIVKLYHNHKAAKRRNKKKHEQEEE